MDFSKKFVCETQEYSSYDKNVPAPLFRKSFEVVGKVESADILICGLGFYDLFVNGEKITKGYLAPYISNTDHITYFDRYDIKPYLKEGENVIGVMLGDGHQNEKTCMWNFNENIINSSPKLALSAKIEFGGQILTFEADEFVCTKGPILFNDTRSGVFYDARLLDDGWCCAGYDDSEWHKPILAVRPRGYAKLCEAEPIKVWKEIKAVDIKKGEVEPYRFLDEVKEFVAGKTLCEAPGDYNGGYIYDFGENNTGIYRLKIKGKKGQKVSIQCSEQLNKGKIDYSNAGFYPDGFCQRDVYYLKGGGEEIFEPMFTYHGYRYIYVTGVTEEQATEGLLTYLAMSSELEERGSFECSDDMANKIYNAARQSDISNFNYFPTDCPHREKNGWLGDASFSSEHMIMTIGAEKSWKEWLNNIRAAQKESGKLPGMIPTDTWGYDWGSGPNGDSVIFNLPYMAYKYRGETEIIEENAASMLRYLEYVSKMRDKRGIIAIGLGDWAPAGKPIDGFDADVGFTDSVMVMDMCKKAAVMFEAVGLMLHKDFADKLADELYESIRAEYLDLDTYVVKNRCQTSQAMALFYDVFNQEEKEKGFGVLLDILKEDEYKLTCGFVGTRVLFHVLSQFGKSELAYDMITGEEFPSYGYYIKNGETTLPEQFLEYINGYFSCSKNHHFLGDVVNWFMRYPGGLNVENKAYVKVNPHFIEKLDWCRTSHKLPKGAIEIYWQRKTDGIELNITCQGSVGYELVKDDRYSYEIFEQGKYFIRNNF